MTEKHEHDYKYIGDGESKIIQMTSSSYYSYLLKIYKCDCGDVFARYQNGSRYPAVEV